MVHNLHHGLNNTFDIKKFIKIIKKNHLNIKGISWNPLLIRTSFMYIKLFLLPDWHTMDIKSHKYF